MKKSFVSFLLPNYNNELYLEDCLKSIFAQSYDHWELVIVDDASTDRSLELIRKFPKDRMKLIVNERNLGITKSLNAGLRNCSGAYIARIDGDDYCHKDRLKHQVKFMDRNPDVSLVGTARTIIGSARKHNPKVSKKIGSAVVFFENFIAHPSVMIRRNVLEKFQFEYDENFKYAQDYDLWLRLATKTRVANIGKPLLYYREHEHQISSSKLVDQTRYAQFARKRAFLELGFNLNERDLQLLEALSPYPTELKEVEKPEVERLVAALRVTVSKRNHIDGKKWNEIVERFSRSLNYK